MRPVEERWDVLAAVLDVLYYQEPMPHELVYEDSYIIVRPSRDVTPRGFDVVLKKTLETVMCIKVEPGAMHRSSEYVSYTLDATKCKVYTCRQGKWCEYVLQLAARFKEEFYRAKSRHFAEVALARKAIEEQERLKMLEQERQREADFAPVDDAEIFADIL